MLTQVSSTVSSEALSHAWHHQTSLIDGWVTLSCGNCGRQKAVPEANYPAIAGRIGKCRNCDMRAPIPPLPQETQ